VRHSLGLKAPRGVGFFTNPKQAVYNRVYNRTTIGIEDLGKVKLQKKLVMPPVESAFPKINTVYVYRKVSFFRWLLCLIMPPLAKVGIGFWKFLLVLILTVLGWVPGVIAAFVFVRRYRLVMKAS